MKKKILVVEDEMDIAELVKLVLQTEDFEVEAVLDSTAAYDKVKEYKPDAILLDLAMPKMNGWEVFKQIRSDPEFARVPIAILTAKTQAFDQMVGLHVMKADGYITKPFGKKELINKLHELFKERTE
jgi:two-component system, OmpR family, response regulator VicR